MRISRNDAVSAGACVLLAFGVLILPLRWLFAAALAAAFHEFCHWAAVRLCGGRITDFHLGSSGAVMTATQLTPWQELFCALAGPLGGLLPVFAAGWLPAVAVCAVILSAYNLLPIYPLDGGRALSCGVRLLLSPNAAQRLIQWAQRLCLAAICVSAVYACFWLKLGIMPIVLALAVIVKAKTGKIPCKPERH